MASSDQTSFKRAVTAAMMNAMTEKLSKEMKWSERWKTQRTEDWRSRAIEREARTGVVMDRRPYSPRVQTQVDSDRAVRATASYRHSKLVDSIPTGSTQIVVQPPATPRQTWSIRSRTPVRSLPRVQFSSRDAATSEQYADEPPDVRRIHQHLAQLAKLFSHPTFGKEARHEFAELQKILPRSGTQSGRDSLGTAATIESMKLLPLPPTATTTLSHFQPPAEFDKIVTHPDRSHFYMKDKPVLYRENTLKTTGKILNCTFSSKYPPNQTEWIGKTAFPNWKPAPTKPQEMNLSQGRSHGGLVGAMRAK